MYFFSCQINKLKLNKTKFKRNLSLGFIKRGIDSLRWKVNGTQSFSGCSPGKFKG